jgi:hypothetical protein
VSAFLTAETEGRIQKAIVERAKELSVRDFTKDIASLPVGSVVASTMTPELLSSLVGDPPQFDATKSSWVLADGRDVSGSRFAKVSLTSRVPDLRGLFLRGLNLGRGDSFADPDGTNRQAGDYQLDEIRAHEHPAESRTTIFPNPHSHTTRVPGGNDSSGAPGHQGLVPEASSAVSLSAVTTTVVGATGGKETRPRNAAVYYYIKIN